MKHLLYLSPVPWQSFEQRPHHFVRWFQKKYQAKVTWVDPYPTRLPRLNDWRRLKKAGDVSRSFPQEPSISVLPVRALPVEPLPVLRGVNSLFFTQTLSQIQETIGADEVTIVVGKPSQLALEVLKNIPHKESIYDAMDDFPHFSQGLSRHTMVHSEGELARQVDRLWVSSVALQDKFSVYSQKSALVRNACTTEKFSVPREREVPKQPTFGYVGTIADWFDWNLVLDLARKRPQSQVILVGPIHARKVPECPSNVFFRPQCSVGEAVKYIESFDVGLIPFQVTPLTEAVDPIKYYEYRSAGLPVLSTAFGEMRYHGHSPGVFLAERGESGLSEALLTSCLSFRDSPETTAEFRRNNSWENRFELGMKDSGI